MLLSKPLTLVLVSCSLAALRLQVSSANDASTALASLLTGDWNINAMAVDYGSDTSSSSTAEAIYEPVVHHWTLQKDETASSANSESV